MTPEQTAKAIKPAVVLLGCAFVEDAVTLRRVREHGLTAWAFRVAGRAGVLGEVNAETAAAALGFIATDAVADGWEAATRMMTPQQVARIYQSECHRWGVDWLVGPVTQLVPQVERVINAADAAGMPLFSAWRTMAATPDSAPSGRLAELLRLLWEHRCGAHLLAIRCAGLSPLEAILSGHDGMLCMDGSSGGEACAVTHGWQPPFPRTWRLTRQRLWADAVTDRLAGSLFESLKPAERQDFVTLLHSTIAKLDTAKQ